MALCSREGCGKIVRSRGLCRNHYHRLYTMQTLYGSWQSGYIDAQPVRAHVQALIAAGLGTNRMGSLAGVARSTIHNLLAGRTQRGTPPSRRVLAITAARLLLIPIPEGGHQSPILAGGVNIAATGSARRLQALVAFGYTQRDLCDRLGILESNGTALITGRQTHVTVDTARRIDQIFTQLELTAGTSNRSRRRGLAKGWPLPMAWDEDTIDDPDAAAAQDRPARTPFPEFYRECRDLGFTDRVIADRMGVELASLDRQLQRHGLKATA